MQGVRHQGGQDGSHPPVVVLQADRGGRLQTVDGIEPGVNGGTGGGQVWSLTQFILFHNLSKSLFSHSFLFTPVFQGPTLAV